MLTEDQDDVAGTPGNDTIKGTDSTLTVFDNIDGGAGTDTIRLTFTDSVAAIAGGVEVANVENVIINAAGEDTTADISGWTGVENVTVNAPAGSVDLISAATGAVTVDADADATVEDEAAATVTVTAGGAAIVNAGDADITVDAGGTAIVTAGDANITVDAGAAGKDAVSVTAADAGAVVVTVDGEGAGVAVTADSADSVSVDGSDAVTITVDDLGAVTLASAVDTGEDAEDAADDTLIQATAVITTVANTALDLTLNGANLTLNATDSNAAESATDDDLTTLNLTVAASALDNSLTLIDAESTAIAITDINIGGAGNLALVLDAETSVTDINAGALTGDISVSIAGAATNYAGGSGVDTITLTSLPVADAEDDTVFATVIDGGAGDADVVELDATLAAEAADIVDGAKLTTAIKGFEKLSLTAFGADNVDATLFGIDYVVVEGSAERAEGSVTLANEGTVEVTSALTDIALVVDGAAEAIAAEEATAADYSLNLVLTGDAEGIAAGAVTIASVGAIALASNGTADAEGAVAAENSVTLVAADATTLTITGNAALDLAAEGVDFTALETVVAGDFDAGLTIDVSSSEAAEGVTITTGDGDDVIIGSDQNDTIVVGNGANEVTGGAGKDTITLGSGVTAGDEDTINFTAETDSQGVTVDVINGFQSEVQSTDDINADGEVTSADVINDVLSFSLNFGADPTITGYLGEAEGYGAVLTSLISGEVTAVLDSTTNILYVDVDGSATLDNNDMAIKLTGVTSLDADANFSWTNTFGAS